jgi:hypothetical protein
VTTQSAEIPAGTGKTADVPIQAVGAGARGNLAIDLIQVVEGPLGLSLSVTNPAPTSGGTERMVAAPSTRDYERLRGMLMDSLQTQAQLEMLADLPIGSVIFPDTVEEVIVLEEEADPSAGKVGGTLTLRLRVKFTAHYVSGDDLAEFASQVSSASMQAGFAPVATPPVFRIVGTPVTDDMGKTKFQLQVERRVQRTIDSQLVLSMVQGKSLESASTLLDEAFKLSSPADIRMTPSWWRWLPLAPFRMDVVIQ